MSGTALANFLMGLNRRNDFVVTSAGWASPNHPSSRQALERRLE